MTDYIKKTIASYHMELYIEGLYLFDNLIIILVMGIDFLLTFFYKLFQSYRF